MNRVFTTGDTHGMIDIHKLTKKFFPEGKNLDKTDYVIIAGDFGLLWGGDGQKSGDWWLKWLKNQPWTTLFVDGNHENHDMLNELESVKMFGSDVGKVNDSVYHLKRGRVYNINGRKILTIGGAQSVDKVYRKLDYPNKTWWSQELLSFKEETDILDLLSKDNKFDYVITHTCPKDVLDILFPNSPKYDDPTSKFLNYVLNTIEFKTWYFGHFHDDINFGKFRLLYNDIVEIE